MGSIPVAGELEHADDDLHSTPTAGDRGGHGSRLRGVQGDGAARRGSDPGTDDRWAGHHGGPFRQHRPRGDGGERVPFAHLSIYPSFGEGTNPLVRYLEAFLARDTFQRSPSAERSDAEARPLDLPVLLGAQGPALHRAVRVTVTPSRSLTRRKSKPGGESLLSSRSLLFSAFRRLTSADSSVVTPGRVPSSTTAGPASAARPRARRLPAGRLRLLRRSERGYSC